MLMTSDLVTRPHFPSAPYQPHTQSHKDGNHSGFNTILLLLVALMFSVSTVYLVASWFSHAYYVYYASKKFSDLVSDTFFAIQLYLPTINVRGASVYCVSAFSAFNRSPVSVQ